MAALPPLLKPMEIAKGQRHVAIRVSIGLLLACAAITPFADLALPQVPGYMTAVGATMLLTNVMLMLLLYKRGVTERNSTVVSLGTAYAFVAAIFIPLTASFPDGLFSGTIFGNSLSTVWLWAAWHAGFGLLVLRFAFARPQMRGPARAPRREALLALGAVCVLTLVSTLGLPYLPVLLADGHAFFAGATLAIPWTLLAIDAIATVTLLRMSRRSPEHLWLAVAMLAACVDIWLTFQGAERFSLGWYASKLASLFTSLAVLVSLFHDLSALYARAFQANVMLAAMANQDGVTLLTNRRGFNEALDAEWRRARRYGQPLSLLMVEIDYFKRYNENGGHLGGDDCLRKVGRAVQQSLQRPGDVAARYGGEEFAVILPATPEIGAVELAERIRSSVAALAIAHAGTNTGFVSVSIGGATVIPDENATVEFLVGEAGAALYQAKCDGRNCARHATNLVPVSIDNAPRQAMAPLGTVLN